MTEVLMNKMHLVGTGYAEMPQDGRRYRFRVERYRHDDGTEFGRIVEMTEIPDVGPYLWIPSYGADADEVQYMEDEYRYDLAHPTTQDQDWAEHRRETKKALHESYAEACEIRKSIGLNNRTQILAKAR